MKSSGDSFGRGDQEVVLAVAGRRSEGLRSMLAELAYPAPVWLLVAHAHSWGADAESVDRLSQLPVKDYQDPDDVLSALGHRPVTPPVTPPAASPVTPAATSPVTPAESPSAPEPPRPVQTRETRGAVAVGLNKAAQHKIVGEGLAVGLLALNVEAVTINRHLLESAFAHAWHAWPCSSWFPQVRASTDDNDVVAILRSSARRKGPQIANWSTEGEYAPRLRVYSTLDDAGLAVGKPVGVAHHQWLVLARAFVSQLNERSGEIRYVG